MLEVELGRKGKAFKSLRCTTHQGYRVPQDVSHVPRRLHALVGRLRRSAQALSSALELFPAAWSPQYPRVTQEYRRTHARTHLGQATGWEGSRQRNEALSESQSSAVLTLLGNSLWYALSIFQARLFFPLKQEGDEGGAARVAVAARVQERAGAAAARARGHAHTGLTAHCAPYARLLL